MTNFIITKEQMNVVRENWKRFIKEGKHKQKDNYYNKSILTCQYHLVYAMLRGSNINDIIAEVTNQNKVTNNHVSPYHSWVQQIKVSQKYNNMEVVKHHHLKLADEVFGEGIVTNEVLNTIIDSALEQLS